MTTDLALTDLAPLLVALLLGLALGVLLTRVLGDARLARAGTEAALVRAERDRALAEVARLEQDEQSGLDAREADSRTAAELGPLRASLDRVESQVRALERDRVEQFGQVGEHLAQVVVQTRTLQQQTASLAGALSSSGTRGTWGELQLRRVMEHAGMLAHCDFDEQVGAISRHDARVRPDAVVRLPGGRAIVVDSKAPMTSFLRAQGADVPDLESERLLREHAAALRGHVETLAAKEYWSAFRSSPELVVCFVPSDAVLAAALRAAPELYDHAQSRKVVLASPATLLAVLRATALAWQQDALTENARELLSLGTELHRRLGTVGKHMHGMGTSLRRSVETYNQLVGTLESRVMVTSRRMHELGLTQSEHPALSTLEVAPRPTGQGWLSVELDEATPTREELPDVAPDQEGDAVRGRPRDRYA